MGTGIKCLRWQWIDVYQHLVFLNSVTHVQVNAAGRASYLRANNIAIYYTGFAFFLNGDLHGRARYCGNINLPGLWSKTIP